MIHLVSSLKRPDWTTNKSHVQPRLPQAFDQDVCRPPPSRERGKRCGGCFTRAARVRHQICLTYVIIRRRNNITKLREERLGFFYLATRELRRIDKIGNIR